MTTAHQPPLAGTPSAEVDIDAGLVRRLLRAQHPDLAALPIALAASGWDNAMFRLGNDLALRLPRRQAAAQLIGHEQRWLPPLKDRLPLTIPAPIRIGVAQDGYPWKWSVIPWIAGETADRALPDVEQGEVLAAFFTALHRPAPAEAPRNPFRGVPLAGRATVFAERVARGWRGKRTSSTTGSRLSGPMPWRRRTTLPRPGSTAIRIRATSWCRLGASRR